MFERADKNARVPALLLKLLFTSGPLSIQVHPDDTFAQAMGSPNGKSEAWYIILRLGSGGSATLSVTGRCPIRGGDVTTMFLQVRSRWSVLLTFQKINELGAGTFIG